MQQQFSEFDCILHPEKPLIRSVLSSTMLFEIEAGFRSATAFLINYNGDGAVARLGQSFQRLSKCGELAPSTS